MEIIKAIKNFFRYYSIVITFNSYLEKVEEEDGGCLQCLPSMNFWFRHYDPNYSNQLFIGWLMWGISIKFVNVKQESEEKKEE